MFKFEKGEKSIKTIRRHWIILIIGTLPFALTAYLTAALQEALVTGSMWTPFGATIFPALPEEYVYAAGSLLFLVLWLGAAHFITDYYLDTWIITNERIVGILQEGFFRRHINNFRIERIQDVKTEVNGIFPTILHIGDVHIETAGHAHDLIMKTVGSPQKIRGVIMEEIKKRPIHLHDV